MNGPIILRSRAIAAVLALAAVGLERAVATLSQAGSPARTTPPAWTEPAGLRGTPVALHRAQRGGDLAVTGAEGSTATVQAQGARPEESEAPESVPAGAATIKVEGRITAVDAAAGTITIHDEDGPPIVVWMGAAVGTYDVGQKVKVRGVPTGAGGRAATVRAQYVTLKHATAPIYATPLGAHVEVEGLVTAVNPAAGTITVQDEDGPLIAVAVGAAAATYRVGQKVEVPGIGAGAGSNSATVQAQFIRLKSPDGGDDD
jgi:Cu/Ag efflux protein CusF